MAGARRVLVLEDIVDHTNVGAVFRSAAALGVDAVLVTPRCADPLYRRSIRVSMGTVFQVPWTRIDPWPGGIADAAARPASPSPRWRWPTTRSASTSSPPTRPSGWRWSSAPRATACRTTPLAAADLTVTIPMAGGVDSLNVAAAGAVAAVGPAPAA